MDLQALQRARQALVNAYQDCALCPRRCHVNRLGEKTGFCRQEGMAKVGSVSPHFGEEACLVGGKGSGAVFFSGCTLRCLYCQNYCLSHLDEGEEMEVEELASQFLMLQALGCHNLNLVTPTHFLPSILEALHLAARRGFNLPLVYNCGGYEAVETLRWLEGVVDIYMPDIKYMDETAAKAYSAAPHYPEVVCAALKEMHRQVGDLALDDRGLARRGLLVRHLVLPEGMAGTAETARFLSQEISSRTAINLMAQYRPAYQAFQNPPLSRRPSAEELAEAQRICRAAGLQRFL